MMHTNQSVCDNGGAKTNQTEVAMRRQVSGHE